MKEVIIYLAAICFQFAKVFNFFITENNERTGNDQSPDENNQNEVPEEKEEENTKKSKTATKALI